MTSSIVSWGLTIALVGVGLYVYRPDLFNRLVPQDKIPQPVAEALSKPTGKKAKPKKTPTAKLAATQETGSASDSQGSKKRKIAPVKTPADKAATASPSENEQKESPQQDDKGLSDKDFAKQLAQTQSGAKLQVPQKQQSKKERRASKLNAASSPAPSGASTEASSTTGRDADDDLTPAESPAARPLDVPISKAGDVSDMLEAPTAKPTTLRLTDISNESKPKKAANKAFEPVVSKKKRNEQQRKEEQRLAREESDRIHEAKKQEQLRKARIAAGTSNQTKANNFAAKANAWQPGTSNAVRRAPESDSQPLLDTFDPSPIDAAPASGSVHTEATKFSSAQDIKNKAGDDVAAALTASAHREGLPAEQRKSFTSNLSEEDQIKMIQQQEQEHEWESVTTRKSKKKNRLDSDSASSNSSPARPAPVAAKSSVATNKTNNKSNNRVNDKTNGIATKAENVNRFQSIQDKASNTLQDAEWEA